MPGGYEWLIIIGVLLLLFGAKKLPDMARSVGQSARVFKGEMKGLKDDASTLKDATRTDEPAAAPQEVTQAPVTQTPVTQTPVTQTPAATTPATPVVPQPTPPAQPQGRPAGETTAPAQHGPTDAR